MSGRHVSTLFWVIFRLSDKQIQELTIFQDIAGFQMLTDYRHHHHHHHHNKHQGLDALIRSISRVTAARANASSVFQLFSFLVVYSGVISKGFGFVAFFASVKASSVCIHLSCLVCLQSVVRGVCSHLFCGHTGCSLPEVSVTSGRLQPL